jgi:hypothetical protein
VTYELGKWSGRLDSNQRPPAPKCHILHLPATFCDHTSGKLLNLRKLLVPAHKEAPG